jgi:hypothetical protein
MSKISERFRNSEKGKSLPPPVRPWHMLKTSEPRATDEVAASRLSICRECPELIGLTNQCKKCGCVMNLKVKLAKAWCPLHKWMNTDDLEESNEQSQDTSKHS